MKKILLFSILILFVVPSCKRKALEQMNQKNLELSRLANERDSIINQLNLSVEEFEGTVGMVDQKGDLKERMQQSIEKLRDLLEENDRKQKALQRMIAGSRTERSKLTDEIDSLNTQLSTRENEISALNKDIASLKTQIDTQQYRINRLVSLTTNQNEKIETIVTQLNTAHFMVGKPKELLEKDVIEKKGGFLGLFGRVKKLNPQFNSEEFKKVDILSDKLIELPGEKVNIVTVHPSGTYHLVDSNNIKQLEITDPEKFWETSKYLVVENY